MIPPRAKLADLAVAAGVSTATVSRVLNGKPGVAEATRTSVLATLERLGFAAEPDQPSAEGLIAVMVPELANPSFALFANELALVLTAAGRHMILCTAGPGGTSEEQYLDALLGVEIAGIVSVSGTPADTEASSEHYQRLIDAGVPAVFINGYTPGVDGAFFSCSDAEAVSMSVAHLRSYGHSGSGWPWASSATSPASARAGVPRAGTPPRLHGVDHLLRRGRPGRRSPALRRRPHRHRVRLGRDGARRGPGGPLARHGRARRRLRGRLRRLAADGVHQPGPDHGPPARRGHDAGRRRLPAHRDPGLPTDSTEMLFHPDLIIRQSTGPHHGR